MELTQIEQEKIAKQLINLSEEKRFTLLQLLRKEGIDSLKLPIVPAIRKSNNLPLSWAQERLWFLNQLEGASATYNIPFSVRISGNLDINALQQTFSEIVQRHEILRTSFKTENGIPIQVINSEATMKINRVDLQKLETTQREHSLIEQAQLEATTPFGLDNAPLIRCNLLQLSTSEYVLLLTMHHIVSDGWSMEVFIQELSSLYQAFIQGEASPLTQLPIQYADFAVWQRQYLSGELLSTQLDYWKQQLNGAPDLLQLPTDYPRPTKQTYQGKTISFSLNTDLTTKLQTLSRSCGTTLFMTLLAGFQILLWRYTAQSDIVVGTPIANRNRAEIEGLIGFFVNTLVLRTNLVGNPSFEELLQRVREVALGAYAHQDLPFELLVEQLKPERDLSRTPLFQVMFILQNASMSALELPGLTLTPVASESNTAKFDLTLSMRETELGLEGTFEYNTDLFESATMARMAGHLQTLLAAIVANPQQRLSDLPLLTEPERQQLLVEWNDTDVDYPQNKCIHILFEKQVEKTPDAVAVVFEDQALTYAQLNTRANQLAHYLQQQGVKLDAVVGICVERSIEMLVGLLAIMKAGGAYMPIEPSYPLERKTFILKDSQISVLLTQQHLITDLATETIKVICFDRDRQIIARQKKENPIYSTTKLNLAYIIYTSGSTGKPKGTLITHQGLVNYLSWCTKTYAVDQGVGTLVHSPLGFDLTITSLLSPLLVGRMVELLPEKQGIEALHQALSKSSNLSLVKITPAHLDLLKQQLSKEEIANKTRAFIIGGDNLLAESITFWQDAAPNTLLVNEYGPTETVVGCCVYQVPVGKHSSGSIPIGKPIANTQLYILDKSLQPVPTGVQGELHIGGVGLARGYLNRAELTALKFIPNPFSQIKGDRLYKTGDLARFLPSGEIEYLGRIDNQVKVRGFRIELGEIEAVISQYPAVRETVVVVREDTPNDCRLIAYLVTQDNAKPSVDELRRFLKQKLPEYMLPSSFVILDSVPLTPNGKIDRRALPALDNQRPELIATFKPPQSEMEQQIGKLWQEVLYLDKVGINDNFFDLGGNSLLMLQVNNKLRAILQRDISVVTMFQNPTIYSLAEYLNQTTGEKSVFEPMRDRVQKQKEALNRYNKIRANQSGRYR